MLNPNKGLQHLLKRGNLLMLKLTYRRFYRLMETEGTDEFKTQQRLLLQWEQLENEVLQVVMIGCRLRNTTRPIA